MQAWGRGRCTLAHVSLGAKLLLLSQKSPHCESLHQLSPATTSFSRTLDNGLDLKDK